MGIVEQAQVVVGGGGARALDDLGLTVMRLELSSARVLRTERGLTITGSRADGAPSMVEMASSGPVRDAELIAEIRATGRVVALGTHPAGMEYAYVEGIAVSSGSVEIDHTERFRKEVLLAAMRSGRDAASRGPAREASEPARHAPARGGAER